MSEWIKHEGEELPVPYSTIVRVQYADGTRDSMQDVSGNVAGHWQWDQDQGGKTIAFYEIVGGDEDGWYEHNPQYNSECPVAFGTSVDVIFNGQDSPHEIYRSNAEDLDWTNDSPVYRQITGWRLSEKDVSVSDEFVEVPADMVNNPSHYTSHPSNVECIEITRHMGFNLGNAMKYIWRCDLKKDAIEDLKKAVFYLNDEIALREGKQ